MKTEVEMIHEITGYLLEFFKEDISKADVWSPGQAYGKR